MSMAQQAPITLAAFLEWEQQQPVKYEFDGFRPVAMTGVSLEHSTIQGNIIRLVGNRLRGGPCRVHGPELKVITAGSVRYPDALVVCTPQQRGSYIASDPVVLFEIVSPSTALVDRIEKNEEYRRTLSVQRYVLLEQDRMAATVFSRDGDRWVGELLVGDRLLEMPEIGISVPLTEIYEDVEFVPASGTAPLG
ncbi:MAG: Uma2 family endonuclease [Proteobacteria bacterium]|nr:Uma2 family endonuclease [Pseudomonadota bacterium]